MKVTLDYLRYNELKVRNKYYDASLWLENNSWTNDPMIVKLGVITIRIPD